MNRTLVSLGLIAFSTAVVPPASAGLLLILSDDGSNGTIATVRGSGVAVTDGLGSTSGVFLGFQEVGDYTTTNFPPLPQLPSPALASPISIATGISISSIRIDDDTNFELTLDDLSVELSAPLTIGTSYSALGSSALSDVTFSALNPGVYTSGFAVGTIDQMTLAIRDSQGAVPIVGCTGTCIAGPNLNIGSFDVGDGAMVIADGGAVSVAGNGFIGAASAVNTGTNRGSLDVLGTGARLDVGGGTGSALTVGAGGSGNLVIAEDAVVAINAFPASPGSLNQPFMGIGVGGHGDVQVASGGDLLLQDSVGASGIAGIRVGGTNDERAGDGTLTVTGTGSAIRIDGHGGGATGISVGGTAAIDGTVAPGSATGQLDVLGGSTIAINAPGDGAFLFAGHGTRASGAINVSGAGSEIALIGDATQLHVATNWGLLAGQTVGGIGRLSITDGGSVRVLSSTDEASAVIGYGLGTGTATIDTGGSLYVEGDLRISANNEATGESGQTGFMRINGSGSAAVTGTTYVGNGTSPTINGVLAGTGTLRSTTVVQTGGVLAPGLSPGTFTIDGDLLFTGGWLEIEIAGLAPGLFDVLNVLGTADLANSTVLFSFLDGFLPNTGDYFDFLHADTLVGLPSATFQYGGTPDDFAFDLIEDGGALRLFARSAATVPEPATLSLIAAGLLAMGLARRRDRRRAALPGVENR